MQRHLLQLWVLATLSMVLAIAGGAYWWEKQLPAQLRHAIANQDYEGCIRASNQLAALQWLGQRAPAELALCRQRHAEQLWAQGATSQALELQYKLVVSGQGDLDLNRATLKQWQQAIQERAISLFRQGQLEPSLALLKPLELQQRDPIRDLRKTFQEIWNRNSVEHIRLGRLVQQERWWEALDSLNRLDHPWWKSKAEVQKQRIETGLASFDRGIEHNQHAAQPVDVISGQQLEQAVQRQLRQGVDPWDAFQAGCKSLGGHVKEDGPESFCQRPATGP
ncbi:MAG: hypothetical protein P8L48_01660 [Synechococcus sp. cluster2_bin.44]|nr:hypothetical protein [Synechococcus sp. cluster2_bin.44]